MKKNDTLKELLLGIVIFGILVQTVCLLIGSRHLYLAIGLWVGILIAVGMVIHMQRSLEDGFDLMGEAGEKFVKKAYFTRTLVVCVVLAVVLYYDWGSPITLLLGVMTLKMAVYLQPLVHKILEKRKKGG